MYINRVFFFIPSSPHPRILCSLWSSIVTLGVISVFQLIPLVKHEILKHVNCTKEKLTDVQV